MTGDWRGDFWDRERPRETERGVPGKFTRLLPVCSTYRYTVGVQYTVSNFTTCRRKREINAAENCKLARYCLAFFIDKREEEKKGEGGGQGEERETAPRIN